MDDTPAPHVNQKSDYDYDVHVFLSFFFSNNQCRNEL